MARQAGTIFIEGTLDDLTFYKMDGKYYVRMKSTLSRKKVLNSPRFARTRMHAGQLAEASKIASVVYRQIPKEERSIKLFRTIVGKAKLLLAAGKDKEVVLEILVAELNPETKAIVPKQRIKRKKELRLFVNKEGKLVLETLSIHELHVVGAASTQGYFEHQQRRECVADPSPPKSVDKFFLFHVRRLTSYDHSLLITFLLLTF